MVKKKAKAKAAMANRGTFESKHTNFDKPISALVARAVAPYSAASARCTKVWADTLFDCVPPSYAVRYQELQDKLVAAMEADDYRSCAELAETLTKALRLMSKKARDDGFKPPQVDGHIVEWGEKIYCFLASGDVGALRKQRPSWYIYPMSDICAVLSVRTDEMMAAVTNEFPKARITEVRLFDDEINFGVE